MSRPDELADDEAQVLLVAQLGRHAGTVVGQRHAAARQLAFEGLEAPEVLHELLDLLVDAPRNSLLVDAHVRLLGGGDDQFAFDEPVEHLAPHGRGIALDRLACILAFKPVELGLALEVALEDRFLVDDGHDPVDKHGSPGRSRIGNSHRGGVLREAPKGPRADRHKHQDATCQLSQRSVSPHRSVPSTSGSWPDGPRRPRS
jgi:hypothetical protein